MPVSQQIRGFDRAAERRQDEELIARLRATESTRVLVIRVDAAPFSSDDRPEPVFVPPSAVVGDASWAYAGRHSQGEVLIAALDPYADEPQWLASLGVRTFREIGPALGQEDLELFTVGLALSRWLVGHGFCPACGGEARLTKAGWARTCQRCAREHFPRTDPAVIVGIESHDGERLLLGANAAWGGRMFSCFAGFIEAGESAEEAISRELLEECGVSVHSVRYLGSQAWPFPRSLMLGFLATADDETSVVPDGEEIIATRWFTREEIGRGLRGEAEFSLPRGRSISHRIIRLWHAAGEEL
ncbi:NAD(+) diphosphatase [Microbacterium amylolyticum]|uniref:NAD(+) diphosphatase n=1 Tax=Microbacterium amylolyticum TaxID=936337 RepID=A0ABS4ZKH2_9MICO|nr:NAD(+) diphosphatase [Microbacterium amylolyticum]MBP2437779.1 NAD+ diphosphatase [Microbacterium amylolyticum]